MGWPFEEASWNGVAGGYYPGVGTSMEWVWLIISAVLCCVALYMGGKHESDAYQKAEDRK